LADDLYLCSTAGGTYSATLPTAVGNAGKVFRFKKNTSDFTAMTIDGDGTETIDGATTTTINTSSETLTIVSDGSNWQIVERKIPAVWTSYTPTISGFSGANAVATGFWMRIGDTIKCRTRLNINGATFTAGDLEMSLPSGLTTATAKLTNTGTHVTNGNAYILDSGTAGIVGTCAVSGNGCIIRALNVGSTYGTFTAFSSTVPMTWASGDQVEALWELPVTGWNA
jgi:hypothetical protein